MGDYLNNEELSELEERMKWEKILGMGSMGGPYGQMQLGPMTATYGRPAMPLGNLGYSGDSGIDGMIGSYEIPNLNAQLNIGPQGITYGFQMNSNTENADYVLVELLAPVYEVLGALGGEGYKGSGASGGSYNGKSGSKSGGYKSGAGKSSSGGK